MIMIIIFAVLWLALLILTLRALHRSRRPGLRICRNLEPRRYRAAGRSGRSLRFRWRGESAASPVRSIQPGSITGLAAQKSASLPRPASPRRMRKPSTALSAGVGILLASLVIAVLLHAGLPRIGSDIGIAAETVSSDSESSESAVSSQPSDSESAPAATPEPSPEPPAGTEDTDPLQPECNLYTGSDYAAGTWMEIRLNSEDTCQHPIVTVSISDLGTGEVLWYAEEYLEQGDKISHCLEEPNNYVISAYVTNAAGVQSEHLELQVKIYAD